MKNKIKEIFFLFPEVESISFDKHLQIKCKKKNGSVILCSTFKDLKKELYS